MRRGCQVLVGTPNRVWSLVEGVSGGGGAGPMEDLCCAVVSVLLVDAPLLVREGGWRNAVRCVERFRRRRKDAFGITPEERKPLQVIVTADSQLDEEVRRLVLAVAGEGVIRITGSATNHVSRTSARKGTTSTTAKHQKPPPEIAAASSEALNHTIPSAPPSTGLPRLPTTARYTLMWVEQPTQKHVLLRRVLHNPQFFPPPSSAVPPGASTRSSARSALVFVLDSAAADEVAEFLVGNVGVEAESLTAHASESEQAALVGLLNSGRVQALVVAEAGVDLGRIRCQAEVVINFDMPTSCEVFALRAEMSRPSNESATPYGRVVSFVSACSRSLFGSLIRMLETLPTKSVSKIPSQMKTVL
ncbi:hypothetical protein DFJ73DRAFT_862411 [Zopfochytrium polystomum]|nr:hypothetical protein DFJ73DRAFT_862411 [Zopfochytrium polystomum]